MLKTVQLESMETIILIVFNVLQVWIVWLVKTKLHALLVILIVLISIKKMVCVLINVEINFIITMKILASVALIVIVLIAHQISAFFVIRHLSLSFWEKMYVRFLVVINTIQIIRKTYAKIVHLQWIARPVMINLHVLHAIPIKLMLT